MPTIITLALLLALVAPAEAAKKPEPALPKIEKTGINEFDGVFMDARAIHDDLDAQEADLKRAREAVATALGVAIDAPLATALQDFAKKAPGALKLAMDGASPKIVAAEGAPENVQKAGAALQDLVTVAQRSVSRCAELVPQVQELATKTAGFPAQLPTVVKDPAAVMKATGPVTNNVKAVKATPDRVTKVSTAAKSIVDDVRAGLAGV